MSKHRVTVAGKNQLINLDEGLSAYCIGLPLFSLSTWQKSLRRHSIPLKNGYIKDKIYSVERFLTKK